MAANFRLLNKGFRDLRTCTAAERLVLGKAEQVARAAGGGFVAKQSPGRNRARAVVVPETLEAATVTARDPATLIGAMAAARG